MSKYEPTSEELMVELTELRQRVIDLESQLAGKTHLQDEILANMSTAAQFTRVSDGQILFTNANLDELFGYEAGELIGKHHSVLYAPFNPDDHTSVNMNDSEMPQGNIKNVRKDGTVFSSHVIVSCFHHISLGAVWISIYEDIANRKQMEAELLENEARYRNIVQYQTDLICHYNLDMEITFANKAYCDIMGKSLDEIIGQNIFSIIFEEDTDYVKSQIDRLSPTNTLVTSEDQAIVVDGRRRWFQWQDQAILNRQGEIIEYQGVGRDITERKEIEAALIEEHTLLQTLIDAIPDYIFVKDRQGRFIVSNKAHTLASSLDEVIGKTAKDIFPAHVATQFHDDDEEVMSLNKARISMIRRTVDADGNDKWVSTSKVPLVDEDGIVNGLVGISRDITDRKVAEDRVRENEEKFQVLFEMLPVGISILNKDHEIIEINPALEDMLDMTLSDICTEKYQSRRYIRGDGSPMNRSEFPSSRAIDEQRAIFDVEIGVIKDDDTLIWTSVNAAPINVADWSAVVVTTDVTQRKQVEDALYESEAKYRDLVETSQGLIWRVDLEGRFTYLNPAWEDTLKYQLDEMLGQTFMTFEDPTIIKRDMEVFSDVLKGNSLLRHETVFLTTSGESIDLLFNAKPLHDPEGNVIGAQGTAHDITERKKSELLALDNQHLRTQFQKEQEQTNVIQRIISTLSHDMRTPLTVISLARDMLDKYYDKLSVEKRQEKLDTIDNQVKFAIQLLSDTVQVARGTHVFKPSTVNLATLCEISIHEEGYMGRNDNHELIFINKGNIETVFIDETLVSRILLNLLSNAVKYSPDGGEIRLELDYDDDKSGIVLRLTDQGMGISEEDLPNIFDLLYRANNVKNILGTGLGLNIAKDCVERHNGEITVESELGKGSTFTVKIPISSADDATAQVIFASNHNE